MSLVTVDIRRLAARDVPAALVEGRRRVRELRRDPAVALVKLLGTAGAGFTLGDARPTRWALLVSWADEAAPSSPLAPWTRASARECAQLRAYPLWSRGQWDGRRAFTTTSRAQPSASPDGRVLVLTRSTLRWRRAAAFYRRVPAIAAEIAHARPVVAFGVGDAPLLRQGTISIWESADALAGFRRESPAHRAAILDTESTGWYSEDLFVRMALVDACGSIDGVALA